MPHCSYLTTMAHIWKSSVPSAIVTTLHLIIASLVAVLPVPAITMLPSLLPREQAWMVNVTRLEPVIVPPHDLDLDTLWQVMVKYLCFSAVFTLPAIWCWVWRFTVSKTVYVTGTSLAATLVGNILGIAFKSRALGALSLTVVISCWLPVVKWVAPSGSKCALYGLVFAMIACCLVAFAVVFLDFFLDTWAIVLAVSVIFPLLKELATAIARWMCCQMHKEAGLPPTRTFACFLYIEMVIAAICRVFLAKLPGRLMPLVLLFTAGHELVIRLTLPLRSKIMKRCKAVLQSQRVLLQDAVMQRCIGALQSLCRHAPRAVHPAPSTAHGMWELNCNAASPLVSMDPVRRSLSAGDIPSQKMFEMAEPPLRRAVSLNHFTLGPTAASLGEPGASAPESTALVFERVLHPDLGGASLHACRVACRGDSLAVPATSQGIYTLYLACSALAEYFGILVVHVLPLLHHHHMLWLPLDYYAFADWAEPLNPAPLLCSLLLQLAVELVVDCVAFQIVARWGYHVYAVWQKLPKRMFATLLVCLGWVCGSWLLFGVTYADNLVPCFGRNMCYCAWGHGLRLHGLRQKYCTHLYPNFTDPRNLTNPTNV